MFLNLAGLLTRFLLAHLPISKMPKVVLKKLTTLVERYPVSRNFGMSINLQLREQLWIYTRFPFNRRDRPEHVLGSLFKNPNVLFDFVKPKFAAKVNILFNVWAITSKKKKDRCASRIKKKD